MSPRLAATLYALAVALTLAAFVHLTAVWLIPRYATRDAFSTLQRLGAADATRLVTAGADGKQAFPLLDPATPLAFCLFDLTRGPARVTLPMGRPGFMALSFHAASGVAFFALTDRAANGGKIEALLVTADQLRTLQAHDDEENPSQDLRILAPAPTGYVLARALAESPALTGDAESAAKRLTCEVEATPG